MARKYSKTERDTFARKQAFLAALEASGGIIERACSVAQVGRTTAFRWKKTDEQFRDEWEAIRDATACLVEAKLMQAISEGNITAIIYFLNNKGRTLGYNVPETQEVNLAIKPLEDLSVWAKEMDKAFLGDGDAGSQSAEDAAKTAALPEGKK